MQTFLLEIPTKFVNGTLIVAKTIPCEEGGLFDICVVEVSFPVDNMVPSCHTTEGNSLIPLLR